MFKRERDFLGRFVRYSELGKMFGVRFPVAVERWLVGKAQAEGINPTELIRCIVSEQASEAGRKPDELSSAQEAILTEGMCPLCEFEVKFIGNQTWQCVNPDCQQGYQLGPDEDYEGDLGAGA